MSGRNFEQCGVGFGKTPGYLVRCSKCRTIEKVPTSARGGDLTSAELTFRFINKGWVVGASHKKDLCPQCRKDQTIMAEPTKQVPKTADAPAAVAVDPPRQMSLEDRRIIFAKVNEVYLDPARGYSGEWTDGRVAKDLNVPLQWVRVIREENCGAAGGNQEISGVLTQARQALADIHKHQSELATARSQIAAISKHLTKIEGEAAPLVLHASKIHEHIIRIEKSIGPSVKA